MSHDSKASHPTNPLGVPVVRKAISQKARKRREVRLQSGGGREGVGVTVGFSTTNKLISRFIRWITRGKVSHAWVSFFDATMGQRVVLQAEDHGYEVRPWKRWLTENKWVAEFELPESPYLTSAIQAISTYLGSDYDYKSAILSGIWDWVKKWWKKPASDPSKLMCAEGTLTFIGYANLGGYEDLDPQTTSPQKILDRASKDTRLKALPAPI